LYERCAMVGKIEHFLLLCRSVLFHYQWSKWQIDVIIEFRGECKAVVVLQGLYPRKPASPDAYVRDLMRCREYTRLIILNTD
jgi:hypothetical protein